MGPLSFTPLFRRAIAAFAVFSVLAFSPAGAFADPEEEAQILLLRQLIEAGNSGTPPRWDAMFQWMQSREGDFSMSSPQSLEAYQAVRAYLQTHSLVRVVANPTGKLGSVSSTLNLVERLRRTGYHGPLEVLYDQSDWKFIKELIPAYREGIHTQEVHTLEFSRVQFTTRQYFASNLAQMPHADLAISAGGSRAVAMRRAGAKAETFIQLQPLRSGAESYIELSDGKFVRTEDLKFLGGGDNFLGYEDELTRNGRVKIALRGELDVNVHKNLEGIWQLLRLQKSVAAKYLELLPVYGINKATDTLELPNGQNIESGMAIFNRLIQSLVDGSVHYQSHARLRATGPIVIPVFDAIEFDPNKPHPRMPKATTPEGANASRWKALWSRLSKLFRRNSPEGEGTASPAESTFLRLRELFQFAGHQMVTTSDGAAQIPVTVSHLNSPDLLTEIASGRPGEIKIIYMGTVKHPLFTEFLSHATFPPVIAGKVVTEEVLNRGITSVNALGNVDDVVVPEVIAKGLVNPNGGLPNLPEGLNRFVRASRFLGKHDFDHAAEPALLRDYLFTSRDVASPQRQYFAERGITQRGYLADPLAQALIRTKAAQRLLGLRVGGAKNASSGSCASLFGGI